MGWKVASEERTSACATEKPILGSTVVAPALWRAGWDTGPETAWAHACDEVGLVRLDGR